jgi:hypothetical protein
MRVAEATGKLYNKILSQTKIDKISFYEAQGRWVVTCNAQGFDPIELYLDDNQMLNDDHHDYLCGEINLKLQ